MTALHRRLRKLEANRQDAKPEGRMVLMSELNPEVLALWIEMEGDLNRMNINQFDMFEAELKRPS